MEARYLDPDHKMIYCSDGKISFSGYVENLEGNLKAKLLEVGKIEPYTPPPVEPPKESLESQLETLKTALLEANVLTPEQLQPKR